MANVPRFELVRRHHPIKLAQLAHPHGFALPVLALHHRRRARGCCGCAAKCPRHHRPRAIGHASQTRLRKQRLAHRFKAAPLNRGKHLHVPCHRGSGRGRCGAAVSVSVGLGALRRVAGIGSWVAATLLAFAAWRARCVFCALALPGRELAGAPRAVLILCPSTHRCRLARGQHHPPRPKAVHPTGRSPG